MPFVDTDSHLTTKLHNFDIKCPSNYESYDQHGFFGTKFRCGQNFLFKVGGFFNKREYSEADCPDLPYLKNKVPKGGLMVMADPTLLGHGKTIPKEV